MLCPVETKAGKYGLTRRVCGARLNEAYSINIDNDLNKKWECLHHRWARWIAISMKKGYVQYKAVSAWGRSNGWWLVNAYLLWWPLGGFGREYMCVFVWMPGNVMLEKYSCFTLELWLTQKSSLKERKKNTQKTKEEAGRWRCKPVPSGASLRISCARCWLCSASRWFSSAAQGPGQRTRNLQRHIQAGPGTQTQNSPWGRCRWLSHKESLGESP